ncbi:restriction endonuclease subunit S [Comamonas resistens]|uniref:restriction endonuclease subunit S n=1 Tax=Comamonas resistens TaxID=3046670 RepID=UPI0039BD8A43
MSWPIVKIGDVSEQIRGVSYAKEDASLTPKDSYLPVLRANNITEFGLQFDDLVYVPASRIKQKQIINQHDVVIAASSGSLDVVGKAASALVDFRGGFGAFCKVLRPNSKIDPRYFSNYFQTKKYRQKISLLAAGANINNLKNEHLDNLEIPLPPLSEQRRIAAILDKAEALRSKRREAIAKLDQLLRSVFLEMFGDPAENPKQWRRAHLGDLLVDGPQNGLYKPASFYGTGTPILRIDGFKSGDVIDTLPIKRLMLSDSEVKKYQIKSNDIIINRVNSPEHLGKAAIFTLADQVVFESNMMRISIDANQANPNYINFFLMQDFIKQQIQKSRKDAINQSSINQEDVQNFRINLPEIDVQDRFAMIIRNIARRKKQYSDQLMQFSTLQTSLQHKFFTQ